MINVAPDMIFLCPQLVGVSISTNTTQGTTLCYGKCDNKSNMPSSDPVLFSSLFSADISDCSTSGDCDLHPVHPLLSHFLWGFV